MRRSSSSDAFDPRSCEGYRLSTLNEDFIMEEISTRSFKLISEFEKLSLTPYLCPAGVWTIGYGSRYLVDGSLVTEATPPILKVQADMMLTREIIAIEEVISRRVEKSLSVNQTIALTSFIYNTGVTAFQESTLLKKLNAGDFQGAADQFLRWTHSNGIIVAELERRRKTERALFLQDQAAQASLNV